MPRLPHLSFSLRFPGALLLAMLATLLISCGGGSSSGPPATPSDAITLGLDVAAGEVKAYTLKTKPFETYRVRTTSVQGASHIEAFETHLLADDILLVSADTPMGTPASVYFTSVGGEDIRLEFSAAISGHIDVHIEPVAIRVAGLHIPPAINLVKSTASAESQSIQFGDYMDRPCELYRRSVTAPAGSGIPGLPSWLALQQDDFGYWVVSVTPDPVTPRVDSASLVIYCSSAISALAAPVDVAVVRYGLTYELPAQQGETWHATLDLPGATFKSGPDGFSMSRAGDIVWTVDFPGAGPEIEAYFQVRHPNANAPIDIPVELMSGADRSALRMGVGFRYMYDPSDYYLYHAQMRDVDGDGVDELLSGGLYMAASDAGSWFSRSWFPGCAAIPVADMDASGDFVGYCVVHGVLAGYRARDGARVLAVKLQSADTLVSTFRIGGQLRFLLMTNQWRPGEVYAVDSAGIELWRRPGYDLVGAVGDMDGDTLPEALLSNGDVINLADGEVQSSGLAGMMPATWVGGYRYLWHFDGVRNSIFVTTCPDNGLAFCFYDVATGEHLGADVFFEFKSELSRMADGRFAVYGVQWPTGINQEGLQPVRRLIIDPVDMSTSLDEGFSVADAYPNGVFPFSDGESHRVMLVRYNRRIIVDEADGSVIARNSGQPSVPILWAIPVEEDAAETQAWVLFGKYDYGILVGFSGDGTRRIEMRPPGIAYADLLDTAVDFNGDGYVDPALYNDAYDMGIVRVMSGADGSQLAEATMPLAPNWYGYPGFHGAMSGFSDDAGNLFVALNDEGDQLELHVIDVGRNVDLVAVVGQKAVCPGFSTSDILDVSREGLIGVRVVMRAVCSDDISYRLVVLAGSDTLSVVSITKLEGVPLIAWISGSAALYAGVDGAGAPGVFDLIAQNVCGTAAGNAWQSRPGVWAGGYVVSSGDFFASATLLGSYGGSVGIDPCSGGPRWRIKDDFGRTYSAHGNSGIAYWKPDDWRTGGVSGVVLH